MIDQDTSTLLSLLYLRYRCHFCLEIRAWADAVTVTFASARVEFGPLSLAFAFAASLLRCPDPVNPDMIHLPARTPGKFLKCLG